MIGSAHPFDSVALKRLYTRLTGFLRFYLLGRRLRKVGAKIQDISFSYLVFRFFPHPSFFLFFLFDLFDNRLIGA